MKLSSYYLAQCYAQLGENDRALEYLERAYEDRDLGMICLKVDPFLDGLRSEPRLTALLTRVGFP
jgi:tetratricopeptide (TPR) repeat protein